MDRRLVVDRGRLSYLGFDKCGRYATAVVIFSLTLFSWLSIQSHALAQEPAVSTNSSHQEKSVNQLLLEAEGLLQQGKAIDARALMQKALRASPNDYRPHMMLGQYYLVEVGHFQLANQYIRRALGLFSEQNKDLDQLNGIKQSAWQEHARLLYLLAESRLSLDNYTAALKTLEQYELYYWDAWLPGSKAWVLWKMGHTDKAIAEVEKGLARGAYPGKSYNILGILLASSGQKQLSLRAFANAARAELSLGSYGQVATPLNNAGEVYRETFREDQAEIAWLSSLSLPDGCDHILPSLNSAVLNMERLRLFAAERVLKDFQVCFAEKAEKKDTEHRALLALIRGRTMLRIGRIEEAVALLELANSGTQWFGRIGTNEDDMKLAAKITLADALEAKGKSLQSTPFSSWRKWFIQGYEAKKLGLRVWWLRRSARILAVDRLRDFEDLLVRHSDSMLEYPMLGRVLSGFSLNELKAKLNSFKLKDSRGGAHQHYDLYLATKLVKVGKREEASELLAQILNSLRPEDALIRAETLTQVLLNGGPEAKDEKRRDLKLELFRSLPSALRLNSLPLPVQIKSDGSKEAKEFARALNDLNFQSVESSPLELSILRRAGGSVSLQLVEAANGNLIAISEGKEKDTKNSKSSATGKTDWREVLVEDFQEKVFSHKRDPDYGPPAKLKLFNE